jgi:hypothetical protein
MGKMLGLVWQNLSQSGRTKMGFFCFMDQVVAFVLFAFRYRLA